MRKTSFYFSFLSLPAAAAPGHHRGLGFLPGRGRRRRSGDGSGDAPAPPWTPGAPRSRACSTAGRRRRRRARALQPFVAPVPSPARAVRRARRRRRMDVDAAPVPDVRGSRAVLPSRRVGGRPDLRRDLRLSRIARVLDYARDLGVALQLTNILRDVARGLSSRAAAICRSRTSRGSAAPKPTSRDEVVARRRRRDSRAAVRSVLEHQAARARVFFDRAVRALPAGDAQRVLAAEIMRAIYWDMLQRIEAAGYDVFTRVIRAPRPIQAQLAIQTWRRRLMARMSRRPRTDVVVIGAGFAGLAAAVRLADAGRRGRRRRGSAAAWRPRDGVHRSRDRRARRQRAARALRLLSRDLRVSRAARHGRTARRCSGGFACRWSAATGAARRSNVRTCRRRGIWSPA